MIVQIVCVCFFVRSGVEGGYLSFLFFEVCGKGVLMGDVYWGERERERGWEREREKKKKKKKKKKKIHQVQPKIQYQYYGNITLILL